MGEDKKANKKRKRIVARQPVQMIVSREYVGTQTVAEAFIPIISEDIRSFSPNREKCGKGITLNADEAAALLKALQKELNSED